MRCKFCHEAMMLETDDYCCDHCGATYNIESRSWTNPTTKIDYWNDSSIQFPRFIAEINAIGLTDEQIRGICESIEITENDISDLFERANNCWEVAKATVIGTKNVYIDCPHCKNSSMEIFSIEENMLCHCKKCNIDYEIDCNGHIISLK